VGDDAHPAVPHTLDNVIEGVVITFVDITEMKKAEEALRKAYDLLRLAVVVRDSYDAVTVQDLDGRILAWNPGAVRMYGWSEADALQMNIRDRIPKSSTREALTVIRQLAESQVPEPTTRDASPKTALSYRSG
jgi:two-component system, chemotaxis family, CheB/CheR fusion protein